MTLRFNHPRRIAIWTLLFALWGAAGGAVLAGPEERQYWAPYFLVPAGVFGTHAIVSWFGYRDPVPSVGYVPLGDGGLLSYGDTF